MSGHTKGPWRAVIGPDVGIERIFIDCASGVICRIINSASKLPLSNEDAANARLIAAAPELLEALEWLVDAYSKPDKRICCSGFECGCRGATMQDEAEHFAREIISKAKGEQI